MALPKGKIPEILWQSEKKKLKNHLYLCIFVKLIDEISEHLILIFWFPFLYHFLLHKE